MRANESTILDFIGGLKKVFIIPPFQRNYEWSEDQCTVLFNDIIKACKNKTNHYLGNIVYYIGKNSGASYSENILIDGQQRITTILILLCAIRDSMDPLTESEDINDINKMFLRNEGAGETFRVRLKQTDYDAGCYERLVNGNFSDDETGNIANNYRVFRKLIDDSDFKPKELYETIPSLEVVGVNLQIDSDLTAVQTIFEKINSTGKPLTAADLLRNYLLISTSSKEQERLYKTYWIKIEETITTNYISEFVKDYLIMKVYHDVEKGEVYKDFKTYVEDNQFSNEDVLKDMKTYAPFYKTLLEENTGDIKTNREITTLKSLGCDDMNCLFMFLLKECNGKKEELQKIFNLLKCFLARYRIVSPSGGGGALRSVIQKLIEKLTLKEIDCTFDSLYFELSNSANPSGRYPDDEEFKTALMKSEKRNHKYGRALLLAVEEKETKNIPVNYSETTIEHLMPQKLSDWWIKNLGGKEKAESTFNNYINCIGNLAPLSGSYNSGNSNKKWSDKIKLMKDVQFKTTKEVLKYENWNENTIRKRNSNLSNRICKAIIPPMPRTRAYLSQKTFDDFIPGTYPLSDLDIDMSGAEIVSLNYGNIKYNLSAWRELINKSCEILYEKDPSLFTKIVAENRIHKSTSTKNQPEKDPIISKDKKKLNSSKRIGKTEFYSEANLSSTRVRVYTKQLFEYYGLQDNITITVTKKVDE